MSKSSLRRQRRLEKSQQKNEEFLRVIHFLDGLVARVGIENVRHVILGNENLFPGVTTEGDFLIVFFDDRNQKTLRRISIEGSKEILAWVEEGDKTEVYYKYTIKKEND